MPLFDKEMRTSKIAFCLALLLASVTHGAEQKLSDIFPLTKATQFVFVDEVPVGNGFGYDVTELKGQAKGALTEALKKESEKHYTTEMDYPAIGILARVMLVDSDGIPLCTMQVVNWDRTVVFKGVTKKEGKNIIDDRHASVRSEALSQWVYEQVRTKMPNVFKRQQEMYSKNGHSIESLLFPRTTNSEQAGTRQSATRPEVKPEGGNKPQPESEGRSR